MQISNPNNIFLSRMAAVELAIYRLKQMRITIENIDLNRSKPVITISKNNTNNLEKATVFMHRGNAQGRAKRMQAQVENCRVEWEI